MNRLFRVVGFEEKELCNDRCRRGFVDFAIEADDALFQQPREDVIWDRRMLVCEFGGDERNPYMYASHRPFQIS
jgi:hypothetical protein